MERGGQERGVGVGRQGQAVESTAAEGRSLQGTASEINLFQLFCCCKV